MGEKRDDDKSVEDRIRAFIRQRMEERALGVTAAAKVLKADQGNLSKILYGDRGVSAGLAFRVHSYFQIDLEHLFYRSPPEKYWRYYVPRPASGRGRKRRPEEASAAPAPPDEARRVGAESKAGPPAKKER